MLHQGPNRLSSGGTLGIRQQLQLNAGATVIDQELQNRRWDLLRRIRMDGFPPSTSNGHMITANDMVNAPSGASSLASMIYDHFLLAGREQHTVQQLPATCTGTTESIRGGAMNPHYAGVGSESVVANGYLPCGNALQLLQHSLLLSGRNPGWTATSANLSSRPTTLGAVYERSDISQPFASGLHHDDYHNSLYKNNRVGHENEERSLPSSSPINEAGAAEFRPQKE